MRSVWSSSLTSRKCVPSIATAPDPSHVLWYLPDVCTSVVPASGPASVPAPPPPASLPASCPASFPASGIEAPPPTLVDTSCGVALEHPEQALTLAITAAAPHGRARFQLRMFAGLLVSTTAL